MLRIFKSFGTRLSHTKDFSRCFSTETMKTFDDIDREKKAKIYELEIDVS